MPLNAPDSVFPPPSNDFARFASRRSVVHSTKGIVACTQPLAAKCGIEVLEAGGNCVDAAVAVAAGLNMTEPCSTGIGGDMFCLFYDAATKKLSALNGSGRAGARCTLETVRASLGLPPAGTGGKIPMSSVHAVSVPGAAAGWCDAVERFGSGALSMERILRPAIELGEKGFPVSEITAHFWQKSEEKIRRASPNGAEMLKKDPSAPDGARAPRAGEIMRNPTLARTFRTLAAEGKAGFYTGRIAEALVGAVRDLGGHLELGDLAHHLETGSEPVEPISLKLRGLGVAERLREGLGVGSEKKEGKEGEEGKEEDIGLEVWEHPPNGQGIVALMALGILQELEKAGAIPRFGPADFNTAPYLHAIVEALRLAFADAAWFVADPAVSAVPTAELVSEAYLAERAKLFSAEKASGAPPHGEPVSASPALRSADTVYFAVSDPAGNAVSFINSNYGGFGTCIVPEGCGFTLQNRAANFSLDRGHPNALAPRKRPYHTIIPAAVTNFGLPGDEGEGGSSLHSVFGVMGGFMQPQGHVQVLLGQVVGGLSPQQALDAPRVCIGLGTPKERKEEKTEQGTKRKRVVSGGGPGGGGQDPQEGNAEEAADVVRDLTVYCEEGLPEETVEGLRKLGHEVKVLRGKERSKFGRGQIIRWSVDPVEKDVGVWSAGSDMRGDGAAYPL